MRLCSEDDVSQRVSCLILACLGWVFWINALKCQASDTTGHKHVSTQSARHNHSQQDLAAVLVPTQPAVVAELDDVVLVTVLLGAHYKAEKCFLLLLPINHHSSTEEPVSAVLAGAPTHTHTHKK